jgi:phosphatidylglycerophosphatase A
MLLWGSSPAIHLAAWAVLLGIGVYTAGEAQEILGGKDSPRIVIDEIQGMVLAAFLLPQTVSWVIAAFLLFRVLDILKPPPAGWCERRLPGGWGVMLDDTVAGLYANLLLLGGHWWIK